MTARGCRLVVLVCHQSISKLTPVQALQHTKISYFQITVTTAAYDRLALDAITLVVAWHHQVGGYSQFCSHAESSLQLYVNGEWPFLTVSSG